MNHNKVFDFCKKNRIPLPLNWSAKSNSVRPHDRNETDKHWNYKCRIFREIYIKGNQTIFTEFAFDYGGKFGHQQKRMKSPVCDLFWLDELIIIELESKLTDANKKLKLEQFKDFNLFIFDLRYWTVKEILQRIGI